MGRRGERRKEAELWVQRSNWVRRPSTEEEGQLAQGVNQTKARKVSVQGMVHLGALEIQKVHGQSSSPVQCKEGVHEVVGRANHREIVYTQKD